MTYNVFSGTLKPTQSITKDSVEGLFDKDHWLL